jgi:hypothetical protein
MNDVCCVGNNTINAVCSRASGCREKSVRIWKETVITCLNATHLNSSLEKFYKAPKNF